MVRTFIRGVASLSLARLFPVAAQILILPLVARHVSTAEYGAVALATLIVILAQVLSDGGLGRSLIRQPEYDPREWSSVFWLLALTGVGLSVALIGCAQIVKALSASRLLGEFIAWLAIIPFLSALASIPAASLQRDKRFELLAGISIIASIIGLCIAIYLLQTGFGAWALIWQQIVTALIQCVLTFLLGTFRPLPVMHVFHVREHVGFALDTIGVSLVFTLQRQAPMMLVGAVLGLAETGVFSMARRFLNLPLRGFAGPASQVIYVRMAALRDSPRELLGVYFAATRVFALGIFPPVAAIAAAGPVMFPLFLSEQWSAVAVIFALAAPGYAVEAATSAGGVFFQAAGETRLRLRMAVERMLLLILTVAGFVAFGLVAVAIALTIFRVFYTLRYWQHMSRAIPFHLVDAVRPLAVSSVLGVALFVTVRVAGDIFSDLVFIGVAAALLAVFWAGACILQWGGIRHSLKTLAA